MEDKNSVYRNVFLLIAIVITWFLALLFLLPILATPKVIDSRNIVDMPSSYNEQSDQPSSKEGTYYIGIEVVESSNYPGYQEVGYVDEGSTGGKAGIIVGDIVHSIDGESVKGMEYSQIRYLLGGEYNSKVNLRLTRPIASNNIDSSQTTYDVSDVTSGEEYTATVARTLSY